MGWKGAVRSYNAAAKRIERNEKKYQRELEQRQKQYLKMQELERAIYEVAVFDNKIEIIQSLHKDCGDEINWHQIAASQSPSMPAFSNPLEQKALKLKQQYKASFFDKLFKRVDAKLSSLNKDVETAKYQDQENHKAKVVLWQQSCENWAKNIEQAKKLLSGSAETKIEVIKELNPFSELDTLGSGLHVSISDASLITVNIQVHGEKIIPNEQKSLLKSGKLSVKKMPVGKFNEIYQDYVCSAVLRIAREIFAILPDEFVLINASDLLLNKATGHLEKSHILSVYIPRKTLNQLNMDAVDPSDCMKNFVHNMSFTKTRGFEIVEILDIEK